MTENVREGTADDLASLLGVSKRTVQRWLEKGAAVKVRRGVFDLPATIKAYYEGHRPEHGSGAPRITEQIHDLARSVCTSADLSKMFGVSVRRINQLAADGAIRKDGEKFVLGEAVRSYCEYVKGQESAGSADYEAQRTRLVKAQADKQEIAVSILLGDLLPAGAVTSAWCDLTAVMKTAMLNLPAKLAPRLTGKTDAAEVKALLESEVRTALEGLSQFDISECVETSLPADFEDGGAAAAPDRQPVGRP